MNKKIIIVILLILILIAGCSNEESHELLLIDGITNEETKIVFNKDKIVLSELSIKIKEDYVFLGWSIDNKIILDNDIELDIKETKILYSMWKEKKDYLKIFDIGSIGRIDIKVNDPIVSKEDYVDAEYSLQMNDYQLNNVAGKIRLRGNSSLSAPKKSYKIKFENKQEVFGFKADKEWALIANYYDPSLVRNFYAYRLATAMGILYSVDCCFAEVYLNDSYNGLYLLCETVKTGKNRVNIEIDYDENIMDIPFLLELDYKMIDSSDPLSNGIKNVDYFELDMDKEWGKIYPIGTKYPKSYTDLNNYQFEALKTFVETAFKSTRTNYYDKYFDVDSVINFFFIQELMMNVDCDYSSVYFYHAQGDKIKFGPVWDFDISCGNCNYLANYRADRLMNDTNNYSRLFYDLLEHNDFRIKFVKKLNEINRDIIPYMLESIDNTYKSLNSYAKKDNERWNTLNSNYWPKPYYLVGISYYDQLNYLKEYITEHLVMMLKRITIEELK